MKWNQYSKAATIAMFVCLGLFNCEDFADETFTLTTVDAAAIAAMGDTLELAMPMKTATILKDGFNLGVILSGGGIDTVIMNVDSLILTTEDVVMALTTAGVSAIVANDTAYSVTISDDSLTFRPFTVASSGTYILYLNHHVAPSIYSATSYDKVDLVSDDMSPELIAGLYDLPGPVPIIKGRYEYELPAGDYLFELARMEATTNNSFRAVLIREQ
ncbi:MAG: hypothetical protein K9M55_11080 [Candidatus Marinimicrobia bacterium]|nr:hypothetical protein [Candidatus Neomarinimicrobiota bacterium]MCF7923233.1 hypothetical protein [Candidatus Neomarinimicrobiota bacterium]